MSEKERIGKIMFALDLGFSDIFDNENVRQFTLERKLEIMEKAVELVTLEEVMNINLSSKGNDHPTIEIYVLDFPSPLRASIYLLLGGYYRQAILCLRNWLELRLTGIYFGFINPNRAEYEAWKRGAYSVVGETLISRLFGRAEFHKFDKKTGLKQRLKNLYNELSLFVHGVGLNKFNLQEGADNVPRFNAESVDLWFDFAKRIFRELVICFLLAYGKIPFSLEKSKISNLFNYLPTSYHKELENIGVTPM